MKLLSYMCVTEHNTCCDAMLKAYQEELLIDDYDVGLNGNTTNIYLFTTEPRIRVNECPYCGEKIEAKMTAWNDNELYRRMYGSEV